MDMKTVDHGLLCLQAKESWEMDEDEKLEQADLMKGKGTSFFKVSVC